MRNPTVSGGAGRAGNTASLPASSKKSPQHVPEAGRVCKVTLILAALLALQPLGARANRPLQNPALQNPAQHSPQDPAGPLPYARITYTRTLAGSSPEYLAVVVNSDGSGTYEGRSLKDTQEPRPLKLSEATTTQIFELASALGDFRLPLESHKKVADLGLKTFTYEQGSEKHEVEFNYTTRATARDLTDLFERIVGVEEHLDTLRYALKYDPLSLPQELLHIQIDLAHNALADPELMVPELEQIAKDPRLLHVAQVRAQDILRTVNGGQ